MLNFIELNAQLKKNKLRCEIKEYLFALQIALGVPISHAYVHAILSEKYQVSGDKALKAAYDIHLEEANKYSRRINVATLINILKENISNDYRKVFLKEQKDDAKDDGLTKKEIKKSMGRLLKMGLDDAFNSDIKELVQLANLYLAKLDDNDDDPQNTVDKYIMEVWEKFNAVCGNPECNREIILQRGSKVVCAHCGAINDCSQRDQTIVYITKEEAEIMKQEIDSGTENGAMYK